MDLNLGQLSRARSEIYLLRSAAAAPLPVATGYELLLSLCSELGSQQTSGLMQTDGGARRMTEAPPPPHTLSFFFVFIVSTTIVTSF